MSRACQVWDQNNEELEKEISMAESLNGGLLTLVAEPVFIIQVLKEEEIELIKFPL